MYAISVWDLGRASLMGDRSRDLNRMSQLDVWARGRAIQTGSSKCKGSKAEGCLVCLRKRRRPVAGAEQTRARVGGQRGRGGQAQGHGGPF